jgi:hypothetical protein
LKDRLETFMARILAPLRVIALLVPLCSANLAIAEEVSPRSPTTPTTGTKVGDHVRRATVATERGVKRAAAATARGVHKAVKGTEKGLHKAAEGTRKGLHKAVEGTQKGLHKAGVAIDHAAEKTKDKLSGSKDGPGEAKKDVKAEAGNDDQHERPQSDH